MPVRVWWWLSVVFAVSPAVLPAVEIPTGQVITVAGNGRPEFVGDRGPALAGRAALVTGNRAAPGALDLAHYDLGKAIARQLQRAAARVDAKIVHHHTRPPLREV